MNLDKYTQKSQEALLSAQNLAQELNHQSIEPAHLLLALLRQEDGVVPALVTKVAGSVLALRDEVQRDLIFSGRGKYYEDLLSQFEERLRGTDYWNPQVRSALARRFHILGVQYLIVGDKENSTKALKHAKALHQTYTKDLPLSRRFMIPFLGSYRAEKFLRKLRQTFPRPSERIA